MKRMFRDKQQDNNPQDSGKNFTQPESDTLGLVPVLKVLPDMLITTHGKYVKMYEFPPVPAEAGGEQIEAIQRRYANVLASLPPRSKFQLTIIPEPIDPTPDLEHFFKFQKFWSSEEAYQDSDTEHLLSENIEESARSFMALITNWYTNVNPISWRMLITISYMPPYQKRSGLFNLGGGGNKARIEELVNNAGTARDYFSQHGGLLLQAFLNQGLELTPLDGPEMAQAVWRVLHPTTTGSQERSAASALQNVLNQGGSQSASYSVPAPSEFSPTLPMEYVADVLAPDNVREDPNLIYVDGIYLKGYSIYDYNPGSMIHLQQLTSFPGGFLGSLFVYVEDPAVIASQLRSKETSLKGKSYLRQSKGFISSFGSDQEAGAVEVTRAKMEMGLENPISIRFFIIVAAATLEELKNRSLNMENIFTTLGAKFFATTHNQLHTWQTALPLAHIATQQKKRNMTPGSLQTFFWPPISRTLEENGRYMGVDLNSGTPLYFDPLGRDKDRSPTLLAIGKMGGGKSVWLRANMLIGLMRGNTVFAVDLEGEMEDFVEAYGGRYVKVGASSGDRINVLDVPLDDDQPLIAGVEQLVAFTSTVLQRKIEHGLEWNALADAYEVAVKDRIGSLNAEDWSPQKAPVLSDISDVLEHMGETGLSLVAGLKPYASGVYSQFFNTPSTLDISNERLVVFGLGDIHRSSSADIRKRAYLWQVMSIIWAETVSRHRKNPAHITDVFLDEVWALLKAPGGGEAIENMARRYRKRQGILWMATQEVDEFLHSEVGRRILKIVGTTVLMSQSEYAADDLQKLLHFSDYIRNMLVEMPTGKSVIKLPVGTKVIRTFIPEDTKGIL
jgi:hypothetical protein